MPVLAQTNLQLFNQLAAEAYSEADISAIGDAYVLATRLFAGLYRASGKPFVAHAIGVASVLARLRVPVPIVTAAIVHSAYTLGEFGTLRRRIDAQKRERVSSAIGSDAEKLVFRYASLRWDADMVRSLTDAEAPLAGMERDVVIIRLANEVDEYVDLGALYAPSWERRVADAHTFLPLCAKLADRLGEPELGGYLREVRTQTLLDPRPRAMTTTSAASVLVPPASHVPRFHVRLHALADSVRQLRR